MQGPFGAMGPAQIQQLMQHSAGSLVDNGKKNMEQLIPQLQVGREATDFLNIINKVNICENKNLLL